MEYPLIPARRSLAESEEYEQLVGARAAAVARSSLENATLSIAHQQAED
jgi:hypothetical protein